MADRINTWKLGWVTTRTDRVRDLQELPAVAATFQTRSGSPRSATPGGVHRMNRRHQLNCPHRPAALRWPLIYSWPGKRACFGQKSVWNFYAPAGQKRNACRILPKRHGAKRRPVSACMRAFKSAMARQGRYRWLVCTFRVCAVSGPAHRSVFSFLPKPVSRYR